MLLDLFCNFILSMKNIEIDGLNFEILLSSEKILNKIDFLYKKLDDIYRDNWPICLIVLNGAAVFASKLLKHVKSSVHVSLVKVRSYDGTQSKEKVSIEYLPYDIIKNKEILLIEDIVDSGLTINFLKKELKKHGAKKVECVTLLFKPSKYNYHVAPNYIGFSIGEEFVVGYGMDFNEKGRDLNDIYKNIIHQN